MNYILKVSITALTLFNFASPANAQSDTDEYRDIMVRGATAPYMSIGRRTMVFAGVFLPNSMSGSPWRTTEKTISINPIPAMRFVSMHCSGAIDNSYAKIERKNPDGTDHPTFMQIGFQVETQSIRQNDDTNNIRIKMGVRALGNATSPKRVSYTCLGKF